MHCNKCFGTPFKNEVLKCLEGEYCDNFVGKKNWERECISLEAWECPRNSVDRIVYLLVGHRLEIE